ncbi:MAG: hypothetical protein H0W88_01450 [Parachlamydiaceae bacterium]|nr:hypothetical protein [Parachlamydiaceae bacterium]
MKTFIRFFLLQILALHVTTFSCSAVESEKKINDYFKNVLLIINFNHPYYDNIEFLKEIYGPYFPNIVFYGDTPNPKYPEINIVNHNGGYFIHKAISHAMQKWPNYKGYICCQDDCFMNFWNFTRLDKNKIWLHQYWTASLKSKDHWWPWWNRPDGFFAAVKAHKKLPDQSRKMLEKNCGQNNFAFTWADFVYFPNKYRKEFIKTSQHFNKPNVFIEIAIPTIILCMEDYENIEKLNPCWGGTINSIDLASYSDAVDWLHPLKFSKIENREFIKQVVMNKFH